MPRPGVEGPRTHRFQTCLTVKEVFSQHRRACPGLTYHRVPMPDFCAPREEVRGPGRRGLCRGRGGPPASPLAGALAVGRALEGPGARPTRLQIWWFLYVPSELGLCTRTRARAFVTCSGVCGEVSCPGCLWYMCLLGGCLEWLWLSLCRVYMCAGCVLLRHL